MRIHFLLKSLTSPLSSRLGIWGTRVAIAFVFLWIGALKFVPYEADSITPFVANSSVMSFFYNHSTEYRTNLTKKGELEPTEREWHSFDEGLGALEFSTNFFN